MMAMVGDAAWGVYGAWVLLWSLLIGAMIVMLLGQVGRVWWRWLFGRAR